MTRVVVAEGVQSDHNMSCCFPPTPKVAPVETAGEGTPSKPPTQEMRREATQVVARGAKATAQAGKAVAKNAAWIVNGVLIRPPSGGMGGGASPRLSSAISWKSSVEEGGREKG